VGRDDVIVVEGVVAHEAVPPGVEAERLFVVTSEDERMRRFLATYAQRDLSPDDARALYRVRLKDEFEVVERGRDGARVISVDEIGSSVG
jgi:hypothetical protein